MVHMIEVAVLKNISEIIEAVIGRYVGVHGPSVGCEQESVGWEDHVK